MTDLIANQHMQIFFWDILNKALMFDSSTLTCKQCPQIQTIKNRKNTKKLPDLKGVFSKPSGNLIVAPIFGFLS